MVQRVLALFDHPRPPSRVTEEQFDDCQEDLEKTAAKAWHEIGQEDYWHYVLDLCYVELQLDLFDYLFPAYLIKWWEGLLSGMGGPESECDFYRAIDHGQVLSKMMRADRRELVYEWMTDAYIDSVDHWSGQLSTAYLSEGPSRLHLPLWSFHALGQSVPILDRILPRLSEVSTQGRAQWWLVLGTGLAWPENKCPFIPEWTPDGGGGGVYLLESEASIFDHGYLPSNFEALDQHVTSLAVISHLGDARDLLPSFESDWAKAAQDVLMNDRAGFQARLDEFKSLLQKPDLGFWERMGQEGC